MPHEVGPRGWNVVRGYITAQQECARLKTDADTAARRAALALETMQEAWRDVLRQRLPDGIYAFPNGSAIVIEPNKDYPPVQEMVIRGDT